MKTCSFCKEEIKDDAIKCRYCQSMLSEQNVDHKISNERVMLVVDRGLIYFAKFAGVVLSIFVFFGVVFYSVDLRNAVKDTKDYRNEARRLLNDTEEMTNKIEKQAKSLREQLDTQAQIVATLGFSGIPQLSGGDDAYETYNLFLTNYKQVGNLQGQAKALIALGNLERDRNRTESSRNAYEDARALLKQLGDLQGQAEVHIALGDLERNSKRMEVARSNYKEAIAIYKKINDPLSQKNALFKLADLEEELDHPAEAFKARERAQAISPYQHVPK